MKKILSLISILIFLAPNLAYAQDATVTVAPSLTQKQATRQNQRTQTKTQITDQRVTDLKQRADTEIDRRVSALNGLIARIAQIKKLTDTQKSDFTSKIQVQIDALNSLKVKIDADTDLATLKTDVKSIVESYRIFVVFMPQIRLLGAADRLSTVATDLADVSSKLSIRINDAKSLGKDTTQLESTLADLNSKAADAQTQSSAVITEVLLLTPSGYPDNKSTILDARSKIKTGTTDVKAARLDAVNIIKQLKLWGSATTTVPPTP